MKKKSKLESELAPSRTTIETEVAELGIPALDNRTGRTDYDETAEEGT